MTFLPEENETALCQRNFFILNPVLSERSHSVQNQTQGNSLAEKRLKQTNQFIQRKPSTQMPTKLNIVQRTQAHK